MSDDHYLEEDHKRIDGRARGFETVAATGADLTPGTNFTDRVRILEIQGNSADATIVATYYDPDSGTNKNVTFVACPAGWRSLPGRWIGIVATGTNLQGGTVYGAK